MRIVHFSDPHVQIDCRQLGWRPLGWRRALAQIELVGFGRAHRFEQAAATLRRMVLEIEALRPDHVLCTGDLTALAFEEEFVEARRALGDLAEDPRRFSVVPGNHDRYTARAARDRRFERHFGHLLKSDLPRHSLPSGYPFVRLVGEALAVIGLDTTRLAPLPGVVFGDVGAKQLAALRDILGDPALQDRAVCVMLHHAPLLEVGRPDSLTHGLRHADKLFEVLAGRPCSLHFGHVHRRYRLAGSPSRPPLFNAGSCTMEGREGYWVLEIEHGQITSARARAL